METNIIYNEDCISGMNRIPDNSIDCIICDLPYGTIACKWDNIIPFDLLWINYNRIIKKNGTIVLFGSEPFSSRLRMSNISNYKYDWIWKKNTTTGFVHAKNMPLKNYENILIFSKGSMGHKKLLGDRRMTYNPQGIKKVNKISHAGKNQFGNIIGIRPSQKEYYLKEAENYPRMILEFNKDYPSLHPTQKPIKLLEYLIKTYTDKDNVILDNCMGSGTTAVACLNTNRQYIGFEIDKDYYDLSIERIKNLHHN